MEKLLSLHIMYILMRNNNIYTQIYGIIHIAETNYENIYSSFNILRSQIITI